MPTRNALASIRLSYVHKTPAAPYHITIQVWSHSYDHPDPNHRSAMVSGVYLTQLAVNPGYSVSNLRITDRYGIDETWLWTVASSTTEIGFDGYAELDTGRPCQPGFPNVLWGAYTGIYDERCLADPACDARRLQTYLPLPARTQLSAYNYLLGPVTFAFDIKLSAIPIAVRLSMRHVGGNGGNPAQRWALLPSEEFVIQVP
jgi:hypothetical protein